MKINAITLYQPWATLIAHGEKRFETRSWHTTHRGLLAIHAAKRPVRPKELSVHYHELLARRKFRPNLHSLPLGKVLCIVWLIDVMPTEEIITHPNPQFRPPHSELVFGDFSTGRFAWKLEVVKRFDTPIEARGFQGLWRWEPPLHIIKSLRQGVAAYEKH